MAPADRQVALAYSVSSIDPAGRRHRVELALFIIGVLLLTAALVKAGGSNTIWSRFRSRMIRVILIIAVLALFYVIGQHHS